MLQLNVTVKSQLNKGLTSKSVTMLHVTLKNKIKKIIKKYII